MSLPVAVSHCEYSRRSVPCEGCSIRDVLPLVVQFVGDGLDQSESRRQRSSFGSAIQGKKRRIPAFFLVDRGDDQEGSDGCGEHADPHNGGNVIVRLKR